jgi:hypothetical protein
MELEKKIFDQKTISDLIKEVYEKQGENRVNILDKIDSLSTFIGSPGDAIVIIPLIKDLLDTNLKNDETLVKIIQLFKQAQEKKLPGAQQDDSILTDKDIEQLFNEVASRDIKKISN